LKDCTIQVEREEPKEDAAGAEKKTA